MPRERSLDRLPKTRTFNSKTDPEVSFTIKKAGNAEDTERRNFFRTVDYIPQNDAEESYITRRSFPMGDLRLLTVRLCLASWDLTEGGSPLKINHQTIVSRLDPEEVTQIYDEIIAFNNTLWGDGTATADEEKND